MNKVKKLDSRVISVRVPMPSKASKRTELRTVERMGRDLTSYLDVMGVFTEDGYVIVNGQRLPVRRTESRGFFAIAK